MKLGDTAYAAVDPETGELVNSGGPHISVDREDVERWVDQAFRQWGESREVVAVELARPSDLAALRRVAAAAAGYVCSRRVILIDGSPESCERFHRAQEDRGRAAWAELESALAALSPSPAAAPTEERKVE